MGNTAGRAEVHSSLKPPGASTLKLYKPINDQIHQFVSFNNLDYSIILYQVWIQIDERRDIAQKTRETGYLAVPARFATNRCNGLSANCDILPSFISNMASEDDFCAEMRVKTKDIHDKSDRLINLKLAVVLTDTRLYAEVLADFYMVFQTIENCLDVHGKHPHVGPLANPSMMRAEAFEKDLEFYLGKDWRGLIRPSQSAKLYCDRILQVAEHDPALLVA